MLHFQFWQLWQLWHFWQFSTLTDDSFQSQITNGKSPISRALPSPGYQKTTWRLPRPAIGFSGQRPFWVFQAYPKRIPRGHYQRFSRPLYCLYASPTLGVLTVDSRDLQGTPLLPYQ